MKKVIYCIFGNKIHGAERRVLKLALSKQEFKKENIESLLILNDSLYTAAINDKEMSNLIIDNRDHIVVLKQKLYRISFINKIMLFLQFSAFSIRIQKIANRFRADYIHTYLGAFYLGYFLSLTRNNIIIELTSPDVAGAFAKNFKNRRWLYKKLHRINCVTPSVYNRFMLQLPSEHGLQNISYMALPFTEVKTASSGLIKAKENTVIYASRFIERKNALLFALIMKELVKEVPGWRFKLLGSGPLESKIKAVLKEEIKNGVAYVGYTNDIISEFKKSRITASFIEPDNYPSQSLFEAMACGNAIIVSDIGLSKIFVGGDNGILSKEDSHQTNLKSLMENKKNTNEMGLNSIKYYSYKFSSEEYYKELMRKCYCK
jgi:glycosyltransferase involved in cell wall biosynthesis